MTKLIYLANQRMPTEKAYGIQIAKMCEFFASATQRIKVVLVIPTRGNSTKDIFDYYDIKRNFDVVRLYSPDFYFPGKLDKVSVLIKNFISALTLFRYALLNKADIIFSRDELPLYFLSFFRKGLVFEAHKFSTKRSSLYRRFKNTNIKIVAISQGLKDEFVKFGFKSSEILVAHDGVDIDEFNPNLSREEARKKLNLSLDKKIVMYAGHLYEWKGADVLLEVARIKDERRETRDEVLFVFVGGTDPDIEKFKKKTEGLGNVRILGHKPHKDIPFLLKAADILVLPNKEDGGMSEFYTSPLKLFEYMVAQRPIVASDLPSLKEILNENNAILVKPDDASALAIGIRKVLADNDLAEEVSRKAFEDVKEYSWEKRAKNILNFINTES